MDQKQGLTNNQRLLLGCGTIFMLLLVLGAVGFAFGISQIFTGSEEVITGSGSDKIALMRIDGEISESGSASYLPSSGYDSFSFRRELERLARDEDVKGLILRINSPGGSAVASEDMYQSMLNFKKSGKKIVASLGDVSASGGYYIALGADTIIASPATVTGSLGVITEITNLSGLYEKLGLKSEVYTSGPQKDMFSSTRERTAEEKEILQKLVEDAYAVFIDRIAFERNMESATVRGLADGRVYSGQQALDLKLVDKVGNFDDAVSEAKRLTGASEATVVEFGSGSFFNFFVSNLMKKQDQLTQTLELLSPTPGIKIRYLLSH